MYHLLNQYRVKYDDKDCQSDYNLKINKKLSQKLKLFGEGPIFFYTFSH